MNVTNILVTVISTYSTLSFRQLSKITKSLHYLYFTGDLGVLKYLVCCSPWGHRVGHDWATKQEQQWCIYPAF